MCQKEPTEVPCLASHSRSTAELNITSIRSGQMWLGPAKPRNLQNWRSCNFLWTCPKGVPSPGEEVFPHVLNLPGGDLGLFPLVVSPVTSRISLAPSSPPCLPLPQSVAALSPLLPSASPQPDPTNPAPSNAFVGWVFRAQPTGQPE